MTITFQSWVGNATMKKFVAQFEEEHPNITVELQSAPAEGASQKLTTQIAGGNPPDVAWLNASDTADFGVPRRAGQPRRLHRPQRGRQAR